MALITNAEIKARLGITGTAEDAYFDALGISVQARAEEYCVRRFEVTTVTDKVFDGRGGVSMDWFYVNEVDYPLQTVGTLSLMLDPATPSVFTPVTNTPLADAIFVYPNGLKINTAVSGNLAVWERGDMNHKITYTCGGGLSAGELAMIKEALLNWAILEYNQKTSGGQIYKEERLLNYHYKLADSLSGDGKNLGPFAMLPQSVLSILDMFRRTFNRLV